MACIAENERQLLHEALVALDDAPQLGVSRKLEGNKDQGVSLLDRALLGKLSDSLKLRLMEWAASDTSGCADRAVGALVGLAVGDWVGVPLEFLPAVDEPGSSRWNHKDFTYANPNWEKMTGSERGLVQLGQFSDDTSMALCMADSLIVKRKFDGPDTRVRFWSWHVEGMNNAFRFDVKRENRVSFGLGFNISKSILALNPGEVPSPAFDNPGCNDSGNGGLMRLAPVPIFFAAPGHREEAMDAAAQSSLTTHPGAMATETARFLAYVLHDAINISAADRDRSGGARSFLVGCCDRYSGLLGDRIKAADPKAAPEEVEALTELLSLVSSSKPQAGKEQCWNWKSPSLRIAETLAARGEKYNGHPVSAGYFGSYCMDGLAMALYAVANTKSFDECLERSVNFLGDADTVAAIACQIAGAFYGFSSIDPRYTKALNTWDNGEIAARAILCFMLGRSRKRAREE